MSLTDLQQELDTLNKRLAACEKRLKKKNLPADKFDVECFLFDHYSDLVRSAEVALEEAKKNT